MTTNIYTYGAKAPHDRPDLVREQRYKAHDYRNKLAEIEIARRAKVDALLVERAPDLAAVEAAIDEEDLRIESIYVAIRGRRSESRVRDRATPDEKLELAEAKKRKKVLFAKRKTIRTRLFGEKSPNPEWRHETRKRKGGPKKWIVSGGELPEPLAAIDREAADAIKAARAACGVPYGTYLLVEEAAEKFRRGAPPKFRRDNGDGRVGVHIIGGMTVGELLGCEDTRARLVVPEGGTEIVAGRKVGLCRAPLEDLGKVDRVGDRVTRRRHATLWLRVGSDPDRSPIWTSVQVRYDRPLPEGCAIKKIWLMRRTHAWQEQWTAQFVITGAPTRERAGSGALGIDVGWRLFPDRVRVACWRGDDGASGEISIPIARIEAQVRKPRDLRSIRDQHFDAVRADLIAWLEASPASWLHDRCRTLAQWKSPARLYRLVDEWRHCRVDGDDAIFGRCERLREKGLHLWRWEAFAQEGFQRWRKTFYRQEIAKLARRYRVAYMEDTDWRQLMRSPDVEDEGERGQREYSRVAAVGMFRELVGERLDVALVPAELTTQWCHVCDREERFDAAPSVRHRCRCGSEWDQDRNAAIVLLRRGLGAASAPVT